MSPEKFQLWFKQSQQNLIQQQHRQLVVLNGSHEWVHSLFNTINSYQQPNAKEFWAIYSENHLLQNHLLLSEAKFEGDNNVFFNKIKVTNKNYRHYLGTQQQYVVFDSPELNIDAFAALSGTINAGGMMFLLWNELLANSPQIKASLFLQRFFYQLVNTPSVTVITEQDTEITMNDASVSAIIAPNIPASSLALACKTQDQYQAVQAISKVFTGHRNRPLVLTADRGRGKSSAMAIACATLIKQARQALTIIITAPHTQAVEIFFKQLATSLAQQASSKTQLGYVHHNLKNQPVSQVKFVPVDVLLKEKPKTHLLLIDEAAAIPVYLLEALVTHYHRVVFSSTQHGYEGAGRGFTLKFQHYLREKTPQYQCLHLHQPIRWAENDPLEKFVFSSCLLNAELQPLAKENIALEQLSFTVHHKSDLLNNEPKLAQLFSVLVTAHYQTSPSDLKMLLDDEQVTVISLSQQAQIIAVALLIREGEISEGKIQQGEIGKAQCQQASINGVVQGKRRLKGQFLPQSLINHCGCEQAFDYQYLRIMRIAVHPSVQQQGIGSYFLAQLFDYAKQQQVDFLGTSFGANHALLAFWLRSNYQLTRIGFSQDNASGEHSALLLRAISAKANEAIKYLNQQFYRSFDYLLTEAYQQLPAKLVLIILQQAVPQHLPILTEFDQETVVAFANKKRLYHSCVFSLHLWLLHHIVEKQKILDDESVLLLLITRILQKKSLAEVCQQFHLTGKKALNQQLVDYVKKHLY